MTKKFIKAFGKILKFKGGLISISKDDNNENPSIDNNTDNSPIKMLNYFEPNYPEYYDGRIEFGEISIPIEGLSQLYHSNFDNGIDLAYKLFVDDIEVGADLDYRDWWTDEDRNKLTFHIYNNNNDITNVWLQNGGALKPHKYELKVYYWDDNSENYCGEFVASTSNIIALPDPFKNALITIEANSEPYSDEYSSSIELTINANINPIYYNFYPKVDVIVNGRNIADDITFSSSINFGESPYLENYQENIYIEGSEPIQSIKYIIKCVEESYINLETHPQEGYDWLPLDHYIESNTLTF